MKKYDLMYKTTKGAWKVLELGFTSEAKTEKYAEELMRDYPEVITDYVILWEAIL